MENEGSEKGRKVKAGRRWKSLLQKEGEESDNDRNSREGGLENQRSQPREKDK